MTAPLRSVSWACQALGALAADGAPIPPAPPAPPAELNSEQKALLDFIVLARSQRFVGFGSSTFSFYLREYRALHGISRQLAGLVDASIIGTDPLFHSAGTVA